MAFVVARQQREIGIRMALGARPEHVRRRFLLDAGYTAGRGALAGTLAALAGARLLAAWLVGVAPGDATVFVAAAAALGAVALVAAYVPARRASRVDPGITMRSD